MNPDQPEEKLNEIPKVDEEVRAKVKPETKPVLPEIHYELSEVSRLKLEVSEEEAQSVQPMQ